MTNQVNQMFANVGIHRIEAVVGRQYTVLSQEQNAVMVNAPVAKPKRNPIAAENALVRDLTLKLYCGFSPEAYHTMTDGHAEWVEKTDKEKGHWNVLDKAKHANYMAFQEQIGRQQALLRTIAYKIWGITPKDYKQIKKQADNDDAASKKLVIELNKAFLVWAYGQEYVDAKTAQMKAANESRINNLKALLSHPLLNANFKAKYEAEVKALSSKEYSGWNNALYKELTSVILYPWDTTATSVDTLEALYDLLTDEYITACKNAAQECEKTVPAEDEVYDFMNDK